MHTNGFNNGRDLTLHFIKHNQLLGVATETEYLEMADRFMGGPLSAGMTEGTRSSGRRLRFDEAAQRFGILGGGFCDRDFLCVDTAAS